MDKVFFYASSRDSLPAAFSDLQTNIEGSQESLFSLVFSSFGVACETDKTGTAILSSDTNLKCVASPGTLTISPGYAITSGMHYLYVDALDTRTISEGTDYSYGDTIYLAYSGQMSRLKEQAKGFYLNTAGGGFQPTRETGVWRVTTVNPGVSGVVLCSVAVSDVVTDLRANNLLKFNRKLVDDIYIVKKDKEADFQLNVILLSGLVFEDIASAYNYTITPVSGLTANVTHSGIQLLTAVSGQHTHGAGNQYLSRIANITETVWSDVDHFFNSGYVSSGGYQFLHDQNLREVTTHPLYGFLQRGVINFQDGQGERQVITRKVASVPNVPSGIAFSLVQERAPEAATRELRDAMRAYSIKQFQIVENQSAYAALAYLRNYAATVATASGYTTSSGLQTNGLFMAEASGVVADGYATDLGTLHLTSAYDTDTVSQVMGVMYTLMTGKESDQVALDSSLTALSKNILTKGARMKVRPEAVINKKYHARISWTEPELVDLEYITGYDVRVYRYNADAINPGNKTPDELTTNYAADIVGIKNESTPNNRLTVTTYTERQVDTYPIDTSTSDDKYAWEFGLRVPIDSVAYGNMSPQIGDYITIRDEDDMTLETKTLVKHGEDSALGVFYLQFTEAFGFTPAAADKIYHRRTIWDSSTANTHIMFPIDIDQCYIAYVRAINEHNLASAWSAPVYQLTNTLPDNQGVILISGVTDDAEYLEQITTIEGDAFAHKFSTQMLALERQIVAAPNTEAFAAVVQTLNESVAPSS